jgi:hypothetical protein
VGMVVPGIVVPATSAVGADDVVVVVVVLCVGIVGMVGGGMIVSKDTNASVVGANVVVLWFVVVGMVV